MNKNLKKLLAVLLAATLSVGSVGLAVAEGVATPSDTVAQEPAESVPETSQEPETRNVTVTIIWDDSTNAQRVRPSTVKVLLNGSDGSSYNGEAKDGPQDEKETEESFTPHNTWQRFFYNLPKTTASGAEITYTAFAVVPKGYAMEVNGLTLIMHVDEIKAEEPVTDESEAEEPAVDESEAEEPAVDESEAEEPTVDEPEAEEPVTDESEAEEPTADEPEVEAPVTDEPEAEEPAADESEVEEPVTDEPEAEEPAADESEAEEPVTDEPAAEEPVTDEPITDEPEVEEPVTDEPIADAPIVDEAPALTYEPDPELSPSVSVTVAPVEETSKEPSKESEKVEESEEAAVITYVRDEDGSLVLDENGLPIAIVPEGMDIPVEYLRDEVGVLVLDETGNPIPTQTVPAESQKIQTLKDLLDPDRSIDIYAKWENEELSFGDEAQLIAVLHGYGNALYTLQWQESVDNVSWSDVAGGTTETISVIVTEQNYLNYWRVVITITDMAE